MRITRFIVGLVALAAIPFAPAIAQGDNRTGFYFDLGANYALPHQTVDAEGTATESKGGAGFVGGLGWGLSNSFKLGVQLDYLRLTNVFSSFLGSGTTGTFTFYTAAGTWYPSAKNFWIRLNAGYGQMKYSSSGESGAGTGFTGGLGVGYDWRMSEGGFVLGPYLSYLDLFKTGNFGGSFSGQNVTAKITAFQIGVTLGYRH